MWRKLGGGGKGALKSLGLSLSLNRHRRLLEMSGNVGGGETLAASMADIEEAMSRIRADIHYTPILQNSYLDSISGLKLFFKCELFQKTGSFKIRGATNAVRKLLEERGVVDKSGKADRSDVASSMRVVTHSSGNHAQALALAAKRCGVLAEIVMPSSSPRIKVQAVEGYGGKVTLCHPSEKGRKDAADKLVSQYAPNAVLIPSSSHPHIIAGQGTIAMEMLEQVPDLDGVIASVSGGGFLSGISIGAKALSPGIKVFGAEPKNADDCARSFTAGKITPNESWPDTICDSLKVNITEVTWPILRANVSGIITVTEQEVIDAMRLVWERMKLVIEPGAACTVAAVLSPKFKELAGPDVQKVGVVLCGGNVDLDKLPWVSN